MQSLTFSQASFFYLCKRSLQTDECSFINVRNAIIIQLKLTTVTRHYPFRQNLTTEQLQSFNDILKHRSTVLRQTSLY